MEITRDDIVDAIQSLIKAGKKMPQADRVKSAADKRLEEQKVMEETVQLWWQLFIPRHVGVNIWKRALSKAMLRYDVNSTVITPGLMQSCIQDAEREQEMQQLAAYKREKEQERQGLLPERKDIAAFFRWTVLTQRERAGLVKLGKNPICDFVRPDNEIVKRAVELFGITEQMAKKQIVLLRCWDNDSQYSKVMGGRPKTSIVFSDSGEMLLSYD